MVSFVAAQLGIDPASIEDYGARVKTAYEHQWAVRRDYGYRDFAEHAGELRRVVEARAWMTGEGPRALFDRATTWCVERKILLPGVTTLARLVSEIRSAAMERLWSAIYAVADDELRRHLDELLVGSARGGPGLGAGGAAGRPDPALGGGDDPCRTTPRGGASPRCRAP